MITNRLLSDQILFRLYGGVPDVANPVQQEDVWQYIEQWINARFKLQHFNTTLPSGETIPDGCALATYSNIPVVSNNNGTSYANLPVMPITLPRNLGIYDVSDGKGTHYIPIQKGQGALLSSDYLLNTLFDQIWYEPTGRTVKFPIDLTLYGVNEVEMVLMTFDMSQYDQNDPLPLPKDMEADLIKEALLFFSPQQPTQPVVSNYSPPQTQQQ